jgi:hypothetical protein
MEGNNTLAHTRGVRSLFCCTLDVLPTTATSPCAALFITPPKSVLSSKSWAPVYQIGRITTTAAGPERM